MTTALVTDTVPVFWSRGRDRDYLGLVVPAGKGSRFPFDIEWVNDRHKSPNGTYGVPVSRPGLYSGRTKGKRWFGVYQPAHRPRWATVEGFREMMKRCDPETRAHIIDVVGGARAAYGDVCIVCAAEVERFTPDGFPTCDVHYETIADVDAILPDCEVPF